MKKQKNKRKASAPARGTKPRSGKRGTQGSATRPAHAKTAGATPERVRAILQKLDEAYPDVVCALEHENPFQLLISTILSAQCTDVRVNQVTKTLYVKFPTPKDFAYADPQELEQDIRPTGFFRNKTKSIMGASKKIVEEFGGEVPRTMEELLTLPGVARKTANVVLGTAFGIASGIVVRGGSDAFLLFFCFFITARRTNITQAREVGLPRAVWWRRRLAGGCAVS